MARIKLSGGQFEAPNTKLMGPVKWSYFYLYVILDIDRPSFVRWGVVGWRIEHAESAVQFKALFQHAMTKHVVPPDQLTLHADRGGAMKAKAAVKPLMKLLIRVTTPFNIASTPPISPFAA